MTKASRVLLAVFACSAFSATGFAGGPFGIIHVGKWQGAAYTTDKGAFSHCSAVAKFDNGRAIILAQNANRSWIIGVSDPSWPFRDRQAVKLVLSFDGQAQFDVSGNAERDRVVIGVLTGQAIGAFRKSHQLVVTASNQTLQFDLAAAGNVVPSIENCVDKINTNGIAAAGDFSNPKVKPSAANASAKPEEAPEAPSDSGKLVSVSGSGFVVSRTAHIVTNNHVVTDCVGDIHGNLVGQAPVKLRVVSTDEENDLALLQGTKKFKEKDIATIRASAVTSGDQVVAIGYPLHGLLTSDLTVTTGIISSLAGLHNDTRFLQISAPVQPGNSGGPLHDSSGNIVGVVSAKLDALRMVKATGDIPQNINFAIKTGALRDFLDNSAVPYQTADAGSEMKTADIASAARTYTMLISCSAQPHARGERK
ncbi:MAG TPA: trypsin-like peptidase domain-containing protein [Xanthobacteraceae bacterium]|nr:trypsin-like peptidase domain-containing protein [Xanthobacteraceae bacterium]